MKYQKNTYSCGAACVVNALRCFGEKVSERKVRTFSGTTSEQGTNEYGIMAALTGLGHSGARYEVEDKEAAWNKVTKNFPFITCVMNSQHWVTVVGVVDDRVIVVDSTNTLLNKSENGVHIVAKREFLRSWRNKDGMYFGIIVDQ